MPRSRMTASPAPLLAAASVVGVEGVLVLAYAVLEAADLHADRAAMGISTAVFFALLGAALLLCGWLVAQARSGARSLIVVVQLMLLGLAWNFWGGSTTWISIGLAVLAVLVLAGLFHPASLEALGDRDRPTRPGDEPS